MRSIRESMNTPVLKLSTEIRVGVLEVNYRLIEKLRKKGPLQCLFFKEMNNAWLSFETAENYASLYIFFSIFVCHRWKQKISFEQRLVVIRKR